MVTSDLNKLDGYFHWLGDKYTANDKHYHKPEKIIGDVFFFDLKKDENQYPVEENPEGALISGHGEISRKSCGEIHKIYRASKDKIILMNGGCYLQQCPICYKKWTQRQGMKSAAKLWYKHLYLKYEDKRQVLRHWVWSPRKRNRNDPYMINTLMKLMYKKHVGKNKLGATLVKHSHKLVKKCSECGLVNPAKTKGNGWKKKCSKVVDGKELGCGSSLMKEDVKSYWKYYPHVHIITNLYLNQSEFSTTSTASLVSLSKKYSFVLKCIRKLNSKKQVVKTVQYELSHARYVKKRVKVVEHKGIFNECNWKVVEKFKKPVIIKDCRGKEYTEQTFEVDGGDLSKACYGKVLTEKTLNGNPIYLCVHDFYYRLELSGFHQSRLTEHIHGYESAWEEDYKIGGKPYRYGIDSKMGKSKWSKTPVQQHYKFVIRAD